MPLQPTEMKLVDQGTDSKSVFKSDKKSMLRESGLKSDKKSILSGVLSQGKK